MQTKSEDSNSQWLVDSVRSSNINLDHALHYVQINSFCNGSTGSLMRKLHTELTASGVDSYIFWGRRHASINDHEQCCASKVGYLSHGVGVRLFDRMGFYSKRDTAKLLRKLDGIDPDVVHLHNIHGYYLNIKMLFEWLTEHRCQVRWTLHDCWAFTGHCAHFTYVKCAQWITHCAYAEQCPQLDAYPKTICRRNCARNFVDKCRLFTSIPTDRMTLITPSRWLAGLVKESFLKKYPVRIVPNTANTEIFKPTSGNFRETHGIGDKFMILGVASPWTVRKGLGTFTRLAGELDDRLFCIVLVGLTKHQIHELPHGVIGIERTESPHELAEIYSTADVFFNPTVEDNFPTVNLEAEACGTPVVTFATGGAPETIRMPESSVVDPRAFSAQLFLDLREKKR